MQRVRQNPKRVSSVSSQDHRHRHPHPHQRRNDALRPPPSFHFSSPDTDEGPRLPHRNFLHIPRSTIQFGDDLFLTEFRHEDVPPIAVSTVPKSWVSALTIRLTTARTIYYHCPNEDPASHNDNSTSRRPQTPTSSFQNRRRHRRASLQRVRETSTHQCSRKTHRMHREH